MLNRYVALNQSLIGCWIPSLGFSGFLLIDRSGNGNHGTLTDMDPGTDWVPSGGKLALDFDGSNDLVQFNNLPKMSNYRTLSIWVFQRALSPGGVSRWFSLGNESFVIRENNGQIQRYYLDPSGTFRGIRSTSIVLNQWQHYILRFDGASLQLWVNGIFISANSFFGQVPRINDGSAILSNSGGEALNGLIDDIRLYDRALGAFEIDILYRGGRGVGYAPERIKHRRKASAAATNRRRRILIGASS